MWGMSPAVDLQDALDLMNLTPLELTGDRTSPINILLLKTGDVRHIMKTISQRKRHSDGGSRPLHFYIYDTPTEVLARHLLLLQVWTDWELPLRQRANIWLEIYGNSRVQERTSLYIEKCGAELVDLVCNNTGRLSTIVDLSLLKYKDVDEIENNLKSWDHRVPFDVDNLRDHRMRGLYQERYDHRKNLVDWDYQMSLKPYASIIHKTQYWEWRNTGVAFEFGDQTYTIPNRTMATYAEARTKRKDSKLVRGFWLDIVGGPFVALGVDCHRPNKFAEDLFYIQDKGHGTEQHRHHAVDVSMYNMLSFMYEMETGKKYLMQKRGDIFSGLGEDDGEDNLVGTVVDLSDDKGDCAGESPSNEVQKSKDDSLEGAKTEEGAEGGKSDDNTAPTPVSVQRVEDQDSKIAGAILRARKIIEMQDGVKVFLLSGTIEDMVSKKHYQGLFHRVAMSYNAAHFMANESFNQILAPISCVTVESAKYVVPVKKEQKVEYMKKVDEMASKLGWACCAKKITDEWNEQLDNITYIRGKEPILV